MLKKYSSKKIIAKKSNEKWFTYVTEFSIQSDSRNFT